MVSPCTLGSHLYPFLKVRVTISPFTSTFGVIMGDTGRLTVLLFCNMCI